MKPFKLSMFTKIVIAAGCVRPFDTPGIRPEDAILVVHGFVNDGLTIIHLNT